MSTVAQRSEHAGGVITVMGFAKHLATDDDYRVGSNDELVIAHQRLVCGGFRTGDMLCHLLHGHVGRIALVDVGKHLYLERYVKTRQQHPAARRVAGEYHMIVFQIV